MGKRNFPLVSVIIPTHNRAWILKEAVESVLNQTYTYFELIVVDDGSTDHTLSLLKPYGEKLIVRTQPHRGVSSARNQGIHFSTGDLIAFLDSDDLWLPDKLMEQVSFFNAHPQALICQTQERWVRNKMTVNPKKRHAKPSGDIFMPSLHLCLVSPSAVMMKRSLFDHVGYFDESLTACEDYDLWLRVSCRFPVYLIDRLLIIKRGGHHDQLSGLNGLDLFRIKAIQKLLDGHDLKEDQKEAAVAVLRKKCTIYAEGCRKRGRMDEAARYRRLADAYVPPDSRRHGPLKEP